jgi:HEAT repeat protein
VPGFRKKLSAPLKTALKRRLAGDDVDALIGRRDRRRLRWLVQEGTSTDLRFRALRALSELQDPDSAALFLEIVGAESGSLPPAEVRTAAEGLGRLLYGDAAAPLRRLLAPDRPVGVQLAAARSLATLGKDEDWAAVRDWAVRSEDEWPLFPDERDCADSPRREPAGTFAVVQVVQTLYADKAPRWWSSKAGKWLESDQARPRMASDKGADKVVAQEHRYALEKKGIEGEEFAATVLHLGAFGLDRDFGLLSGLVGRGLPVLQALGLQGDRRSIGTVRAWLARNEDAADAARAAGRLGWPELATDLSALRGRTEDEATRKNIAWALGECGGEEAVRVLVEIVRSREEDLSEDEFRWVALSLKRCGVIGREAIRGSVAIARAGGGERDRVKKLAEIAGIH